MSETTTTEDALRRLFTVVGNLNTASGHCVICGGKTCHDDCAVEFARQAVAELPMEEFWSSPVPPYDHEIDGDYSSFLARNNCD